MARRYSRPPAIPFVRVVLVLAVAAAGIYWLRAKFNRRATRLDTLKADQQAEQPQFPDADLTRKFLQIEAEQNQLDQTVWPAELIAEKHEEVFVKLWDDLRTNADEFVVLKSFPFEALFFGKPTAQSEHDRDIKEFSLKLTPETIPMDRWRQLLDTWKSEGYRVEQTEWRHPQFDTGPPPRSVIYLEAHVNNPTRQERSILRGNLRVEWGEGPDGDRTPFARLIDATDLKILSRRGEPAFQAVLAAAIEPLAGTIFIDPLILSEVILGCKNVVLRNNGNGQFQKETLCPQLRSLINAAVIADFDGDGRADFLAADQRGLLLFSGDDGGRFTQAGRRVWSAVEPLLNPFVMTAGDIDGNGSLDIWLAQYKLPYVGGQMPTPFDDANDGFPSFLLTNDGQGRFRDATVTAGLAAKRFRRTYSSSLVDLDDDGDLDLLVVSDFAGVDIYYNDGRGHFTEMTDKVLQETHAFGMAHTFGDYDGDGRLDFLMIGMNSFVAQRLNQMGLGPAGFPDNKTRRSRMAYGNRMYLARADKFEQTQLSDQVARSGWSWGATSFDFDNDGDLDIYIVNGHKSRPSARDYETQFWRHDIYAASSRLDPALDLYFKSTADKFYGAGQSYGGYEKNRLFMNESAGSFLEIGYFMGVSAEEDCRNLVSDDLDGDGKLDLLLTTFEEWPEKRQGLHILQNRWSQSGNWIGVRLREKGGGSSPVGAKITLDTPAGKQIRRLVTGDSYRSQHANTAHFGLGVETNVNSIEVRWPNGRTKRVIYPAINRYHEISPN